MKERLDVVTRLREHQANLRDAPEVPPRAAVIALPEAPVDADQLRELAEVEGGGDGPLPVYRLDDARAPRLLELIAELRGRGIRELIVWGAREQPGFARALALRFEGSVRMTAPAIAAGAAPCGFVPPRCARGGHDEERRVWLEQCDAFGLGDSARSAALGLDPLLERALSRTPPVREPRPLALAIEGLDGSGKSTHAAALTSALRTRGISARTVKLYRQGNFLAFAGELGARTRRGAPLAAFRVSRILKLVDSIRAMRDEISPAACDADVLVFDRGPSTHIAAARAQLGWDLGDHPALALFPEPAATFLLEVPVGAALDRLRERREDLSADEHPTGLLGYARELGVLAAGDPRFIRIDGTRPFAINAATILERALSACRAREIPRAASPLGEEPPRVSRPHVERGPRAQITIGSTCDRELGADLLALADFARAHLGGGFEAFTDAFWLEAYAAEVALDACMGAGATSPRAYVALWPAVFARLELFSDLTMLRELERITLGNADVVAVDLSMRNVEATLRRLLPEAPPAWLIQNYAEALRARN